MQPQVSIVIVNYNTCDLLRSCLNSIYKYQADIAIEIIVVDNASSDESQAMILAEFKKVIWIQTGYNAGFGRANNMGVRKATGQYILLLNSDTEMLEGTLAKSLEYHIHSETIRPTGTTSCRMVDFHGNVLANSNTDAPFFLKVWEANPLVIFLKSKLGLEYKNYIAEKNERHNHEHEALWIGGAFVMLNAKLCKEENLYLDEDFFMYGEDIEWCHRMTKAGYKHYFHTNTTVIHLDGGSPTISRNKLAQITISVWLCARKVHGLVYFFAYFGMLWLNYVLDGLLFWLANKRRALTDLELQSKVDRTFLWNLAKAYFWKIGFEYHSKPSSAKDYLKYAPPKY